MISRDLCTYGQDINKIISSNGLHLIKKLQIMFSNQEKSKYPKIRITQRHRKQILEI